MTIPKLKRWTPIYVEWVDSCGGHEGWHENRKDATKIVGCVTVGFVAGQSADVLRIVHSRDKTNGQIMGELRYPGCGHNGVGGVAVTLSLWVQVPCLLGTGGLFAQGRKRRVAPALGFLSEVAWLAWATIAHVPGLYPWCILWAALYARTWWMWRP